MVSAGNSIPPQPLKRIEEIIDVLFDVAIAVHHHQLILHLVDEDDLVVDLGSF